VGLVLASAPMELEPIGLEGDRIRWFDEATRAYAEQFRYRPRKPWERTGTPCCSSTRER
jgi:hypothetical protein